MSRKRKAESDKPRQIDPAGIDDQAQHDTERDQYSRAESHLTLE